MMSLPSPNLAPAADLPETAELELQQELRHLFEVDSEKDLQAYLNLVQNLQAASWTADIQTLYRAVHTIKGGAVTVGADGILYVAIALEDLLSDLRYLEAAPPLDNSKLSQILWEGGELLASAISLEGGGDAALAAVEPKVKRLQVLREEIQQAYLPEWNEQAQWQCEFAEQGLDLVVLDLEMALTQLVESEPVPAATANLAQEMLEQLRQIGEELALASGWTDLLQAGQSLLEQQESNLWRSRWPALFQALKACAKHGGNIQPVATAAVPLPEILWEIEEPETENWEQQSDAVPSPEMLLEMAFLAETAPEITPEIGDLWKALKEFEAATPAAIPSPRLAVPPKSPIAQKLPQRPTPAPESIPIPVPLERLDRSAQHLVDTLLSARATQGSYQALYPQLRQLAALAQESIKYITQLRQLQDDYALSDNLGDTNSNGFRGPVPERYRKGYTIINRLLENSLRLAELGAETEQTARKTSQRLQQLDRQILRLRDTIEDSRLLPFQNLGFRGRAILRDLTNRYGKPAQLVVQGESLELDVGTAKALEPVLLHLIRNAYDHGLEPAAERLALGKPESGTLAISLQRRGSTFVLTFQDDGRGIDAQAIQARATVLGLPLTEVETPSDLLAVLCQPGFSSQSQVSDLSGRGVGLDVVAAQVAQMGGQLSFETLPGSGTTFTLKFPVPHLLVPCLLLQAGDCTFAIPTEQVGMTALFGQLAASPVEDSRYCYDWEIREGEATIPGLNLLTYWHSSSRPRRLAETAICAYVRSQQDRPGIWLLADKLLVQADLSIQPLPSPLIAPIGLIGVSLQPDGKLIPVLEVAALAEQLLNAPTEPLAVMPSSFTPAIPAAPPTEELAQLTSPRILIVDDAALMRRRIEASLSACGYLTHACADGLEAWNWLQSHPQPAMILTDIEMPNLDGFTLIEQCRKAGITAPILVISSRLAEEWGTEARRLGATGFLTKGFSTPELIAQVNACLDRAHAGEQKVFGVGRSQETGIIPA